MDVGSMVSPTIFGIFMFVNFINLVIAKMYFGVRRDDVWTARLSANVCTFD